MAGDQRVLKQNNRMSIVRLLKSHPELARGDLSTLTGLAESTVSVLVGELLEEGWLRTSDVIDDRPRTGRRAKRLELDPTRLTLLGAEIGVDYLAVTACNLIGEELFTTVVPYTHLDETRTIGDTALMLAEARNRLSGLGRAVLGIGVGVPGMLSAEGMLHISPNLGWRNVPITEHLGAALARTSAGGYPFTVLNDAKARAMGHHVFGSFAGADSLIYLNLGAGFGAGIVVDDHLLHGHDGLTGEVGHSVIDPRGVPCRCGRRGCAETVLSLKGLSRLVTGSETPTLTIEELLRRLEAGEHAVKEATLFAGEQLGLIVHNLLVTMNPSVVIIGGPLSLLPPFVESALQTLRSVMGDSSWHEAIVRTCSRGASAGAVGAAAGVLHELLQPVAHASVPLERAG